jgi:hypothetical protein
VKLSTTPREGKAIIPKISEPGDVLGPNPVVSSLPYEVTAEMMEPGQANFVPPGLAAIDERLSRSGRAPCPAVESQLLHRLGGDSHAWPLDLALRKIRQVAAFLVEQASSERRLQPAQTQADPRGDRGNHRHHPRNRQPPVLQIPEEATVEIKGATLVIRSRPALEKIIQS